MFPHVYVFVENHARFVDVLLADVYPPPFYTRDLSHDEVISYYIYIYMLRYLVWPWIFRQVKKYTYIII